MNFPCSLCGSLNWPTLNTSCELCYGEPICDPEEYDEEWEDETEQADADLRAEIIHDQRDAEFESMRDAMNA